MKLHKARRMCKGVTALLATATTSFESEVQGRAGWSPPHTGSLVVVLVVSAHRRTNTIAVQLRPGGERPPRMRPTTDRSS